MHKFETGFFYKATAPYRNAGRNPRYEWVYCVHGGLKLLVNSGGGLLSIPSDWKVVKFSKPPRNCYEVSRILIQVKRYWSRKFIVNKRRLSFLNAFGQVMVPVLFSPTQKIFHDTNGTRHSYTQVLSRSEAFTLTKYPLLIGA